MTLAFPLPPVGEPGEGLTIHAREDPRLCLPSPAAAPAPKSARPADVVADHDAALAEPARRHVGRVAAGGAVNVDGQVIEMHPRKMRNILRTSREASAA